MLCATDGKQRRFQVHKLQTPTFTYPEATLRAEDVLSIEVFPDAKWSDSTNSWNELLAYKGPLGHADQM